MHTRQDQNVLSPLYFRLPGNEILTITFNIMSLQGNVLSQSLFELSWPFKKKVFAWFSVMGTDRNKMEPYQENAADEEGFQIHLSVTAVMATCDVWAGALSC